MQEKYVITISRQFGSNGRHIGMALAKALEISFYDKEVIKLAAQKSGISERMFEQADEMPSNSFLYTLSVGERAFGQNINYLECLSNDKLFLMQSKVIRELAEENSCVIVGRCADYILRDQPRCYNFFIHASDDYRVNHVMKENNIDEKQAKELIKKIGKKRASYNNYYSDVEWGAARNYHLSLDVTNLTEEEAVTVLKHYIEIANK